MTDEPLIMVTPTMLFCPEHLEPFRAEWPRGYAPAMICVFHQAMQDEEIIAAYGGRIEAISGALREYGPLCCRLAPDVLEEITTGALDDDLDRMMEVVRKYGPPPPPK